MLSKNKQKLLRLLSAKKHRDELGLFIAEGPKVVGDLLPIFKCYMIFATSEWIEKHQRQIEDRVFEAEEVIEVTQTELEQASLLKTPRDVLAIFRRTRIGSSLGSDATVKGLAEIATRELTLALDGVQDPGNLGTIIRIADWFGINHIFCSPDTADAFSPKTIQATMGAIGRVTIHYVELNQLFNACTEDVAVYGTFLDGTNIYSQDLTTNGIIVMGNEGNGISDHVASAINRRLFIPSFPPERPTSESLNVAIATAITCAEFRRRHPLLA